MTTDLLARLPQMEREAEECERKAQALRQIIAGVRALNGEAAALLRRFESHGIAFETRPLDSDGPRGPQAVLRVMAESPKREWKVVEVKREMLRRGWAPTPKAVEASIRRLRVDGELVATRYGYYRLARSPAGVRTDVPTDGQRKDGEARQ